MSLQTNSSLVGSLTPFSQVVEDLSPYGLLLDICGEPYRAYPDDNHVFMALTIALHWKEYEVNFARINNLRHWLSQAEKYNFPQSNLPLESIESIKEFISKVICHVYPASADETINAKRNKNLEFITEIFSIRFNNYTIGGQ